MTTGLFQEATAQATEALYNTPMRLLVRALLALLATGAALASVACVGDIRPDHSGILSAKTYADGTADFRFTVGKSGIPKIVLLEIPAGHLAWPADHMADDTKYSMALNGTDLHISHLHYRVVKEIQLPKNAGNFFSDSQIKLPEGGPNAFLQNNPPGSPGCTLVKGYQLSPDLVAKAKAEHLAAAVADPDGKVIRLYSMAP